MHFSQWEGWITAIMSRCWRTEKEDHEVYEKLCVPKLEKKKIFRPGLSEFLSQKSVLTFLLAAYLYCFLCLYKWPYKWES